MKTVCVSVVIPTYNRVRTLTRAVQSALGQSVPSIEVIVVDDGSSDATRTAVEAIHDERIVYVRHPINRGGSAARNTGISRAEGGFIAFLDSDDTWHPRKLERQLEEFNRRGDGWVAAYCGFRQRRANIWFEYLDRWIARETGVEGGAELAKSILLRQIAYGGASTLMARSGAVSEIGGFDEDFGRFQDVEFLLRLLEVGRLGYVDEVLVDKYDTGSPRSEVAVQALRLLGDKFEALIRENGIHEEFAKVQSGFLAKHHFAEGRFSQGWRALRGAAFAHPRDVLGVVLGVLRGIRISVAQGRGRPMPDHTHVKRGDIDGI